MGSSRRRVGPAAPARPPGAVRNGRTRSPCAIKPRQHSGQRQLNPVNIVVRGN